jgi:signal transduction histidine kinase
MTQSDSSCVAVPHPDGNTAAARRIRLNEGVRNLLQVFTRTASSALNLPAGLTVLCHAAPAALPVGGASAWIHDRRSHELVLTASTGTGGAAEGTRLPADSALLPSSAMRAERARAWLGASGTPGHVVAVPLRGRRRALGVLMLEDLDPLVAADPEFLREADDLSTQLSSAIENLLLLEDVLRSRRELACTFDSIEDLVAICDHRLRLIHANRTLAVRLGAPHERIHDRPLADLLGHDTARWIESCDAGERLRQATADSRELDDPVLGGRFTMTLTPLPAQDGRPAGLVFVARDVTTQTRLEAERTALRERLAQTEKLASLGQFIAGIAHELNNPLQGVVGHLELLRRQGRVPAGIRRELGIVTREADRAARIVGNLLAFSGGRPAHQRPLQLNALVARTLALRSATWKALRIEGVRRLDDRKPLVTGNRLLLQQALLNVLINAEQELSAIGGGRIVVSTRVLDQGELVRLTVRDTGPGIAADALPRLFEPFFSTKEVGQGTGLGLAITYGILKDHRGTISAENHQDGGAVFTIELPIVERRSRGATGPGQP